MRAPGRKGHRMRIATVFSQILIVPVLATAMLASLCCLEPSAPSAADAAAPAVDAQAEGGRIEVAQQLEGQRRVELEHVLEAVDRFLVVDPPHQLDDGGELGLALATSL